MKLILASSSPYRRELLERLKIPFEVTAPEVDETPHPGETPDKLVERLAIEKAQKIAGKTRGVLVIGSDQVAVYNGNIVGKPHSHDKAAQQLREASGRTVTLYTGLALINADTQRIQREVIPYRVTFRALTDAQIEAYLHKEQPYSCSGSVKSEGLGIALLEKFEGDDPNTLIGLPLIRLVRMLENEGIKII
ncbi:septum formation protein Maf [Sulfuricaulis limicola]|uniref:7-methyl-GTP pyrophosphatase n=1 Tax=Sulfuricaulis limicola TaxID=1620215 RepID=A0A1B4XFV4_9GAMM|nr:Maf family nucleotide pyrophosphatase [Sulfuricaulis limicola]BAV33673.1 septum formation protein Maf [Sulfuricaulis limicola]